MMEKYTKLLQSFILELVESNCCLSLSEKTNITTEIIAENLIYNDKELSIRFKPAFEEFIFKELFKNKQTLEFYHYTSLETIFYILKSGKVHLSSLIGLNDKSEVNYINEYMEKGWENKFHPITLTYHNSRFIICFSKKRDNLTQWRLYGNEGKGVMLKFNVVNNFSSGNNIYLNDINYNLKNFDIIKEYRKLFREKFKISFNLEIIDYWKFFYKKEDYSDEAETRLIVNTPHQFTKHIDFKINRYGIITPYIELDCINKTSSSIINLTEIMIGPCVKESEINAFQIGQLVKRLYTNELGLEIPILTSAIDHYR